MYGGEKVNAERIHGIRLYYDIKCKDTFLVIMVIFRHDFID